MDPQRWQHEIRRDLKRHGLPGEYVERLLDELLDHWFCVQKEDSSMIVPIHSTPGDRLGEPAVIAAEAVAQFRRRTFAGRRPKLAFLAGPVVLTLANFVACLLLAVAASAAAGWAAGDLLGLEPMQAKITQFQVLQWAGLAMGFVPFALSAYLLARMAERAAVDWKWLLPGILLLTFLAASFFATAELRMDPPRGSFGAGFNSTWTTLKVLQGAAPLAIGVWAVLRIRRRTHRDVQPA